MRRMLGMIIGVGLGATLSQFPEFAQQYAQRLGGAIDELSAITANFDASAEREGLSRDQAFVRYETSQDSFIVEQGKDAREVFVRYDKLQAHQIALQNAGPLQKITSFANFYDPKISARTWDDYEPAVPVTVEGAAFAGAGLVGGYGLVGLLALPFRRRKKVQVA